MSNSINLISPKKEARFAKYYKGIHVLRLIAMTLLFGVSTSAIILFMLIALSPLPQLQKQEQNERIILAQSHPEMAKIQVIHDRTKVITSLMGTRNRYDKVLASLRSKMVSNLELVSFSIVEKNVSITVSSKSLTSIDTFLNRLTAASGKGKEFSKVTLTNVIQDNENGVYVTSIQIILL